MTMKGMNPHSVEAMAEELQAESAQITASAEEAIQIMRSLQWSGQDRDAFEQQLFNLCETTKQAAAQLGILAQRANSEAQQQRLASAS